MGVSFFFFFTICIQNGASLHILPPSTCHCHLLLPQWLPHSCRRAAAAPRNSARADWAAECPSSGLGSPRAPRASGTRVVPRGQPPFESRGPRRAEGGPLWSWWSSAGCIPATGWTLGRSRYWWQLSGPKMRFFFKVFEQLLCGGNILALDLV